MASNAFCPDCYVGWHELNRPISPYWSQTTAQYDPDTYAHLHHGPNDWGTTNGGAEITQRDVIKLSVSAGAESDLLSFDASLVATTETVSRCWIDCSITDPCKCKKAHAWHRYYKTEHNYMCNCDDWGCGDCTNVIYMWKKAFDGAGATSLPSCNPISGCEE